MASGRCCPLPCHEFDPHDAVVITDRRANAVVVGNCQVDWCLPWSNGWLSSGAVHVAVFLMPGADVEAAQPLAARCVVARGATFWEFPGPVQGHNPLKIALDCIRVMEVQLTKSVFLGVAAVVICGLFSAPAHAGSFSFESLAFTSPTFTFGPTDVTISNFFASGGYEVASAEFCVDSSCSGGPRGVDLRLTGVNISCQNEGFDCTSPLDLIFQASTSFNPFPGSLLINATMDGSGTASGYLRFCLQDANNVCASDLTGNQFFTSAFGPTPNTTAFGSFNTNGNFTLLGDLHINALSGATNASAILLPDSIQISIQQAPEPVTIGLLGAGLFSLAIFRKFARR